MQEVAKITAENPHGAHEIGIRLDLLVTENSYASVA